jgi:hypothetical protein
MRKRARGVSPRSHHGERGAQRKRLRDRIAAGPATVTQCLQDRVCRGLREIELAHDVGEPQPRVCGPRQELDDVEHP